jgi:hypothetical protein
VTPVIVNGGFLQGRTDMLQICLKHRTLENEHPSRWTNALPEGRIPLEEDGYAFRGTNIFPGGQIPFQEEDHSTLPGGRICFEEYDLPEAQ